MDRERSTARTTDGGTPLRFPLRMRATTRCRASLCLKRNEHQPRWLTAGAPQPQVMSAIPRRSRWLRRMARIFVAVALLHGVLRAASRNEHPALMSIARRSIAPFLPYIAPVPRRPKNTLGSGASSTRMPFSRTMRRPSSVMSGPIICPRPATEQTADARDE